MRIMFLTAGLGNRLRPATLKKPKPALELLNVPLLAYGAHLTACLAPEAIIANVHYMPMEIDKLAHQLWRGTAKVAISDESVKILGSGGGISKAQRFLEVGGGTILYANGDEVFLPVQHDILRRVQGVHEESGALATLVVMPHPLVGSKFGGVWADAISGDVVGFGKESPRDGLTGWHFTGYMFLSQNIFKYLKHDRDFNILYDGLAAAIAQGELVKSFHVSGSWHEVGHYQDFFTVTHSLLKDLVQHFEMESAGESEYVSGSELSSQYLVEVTRHYSAGFLIWKKDGQLTIRPLINFTNVTVDASGIPKTSWSISNLDLDEGAIALIAADVTFTGKVWIKDFAVVGANVNLGEKPIMLQRSILMSSTRWPKDKANLTDEIIVLN